MKSKKKKKKQLPNKPKKLDCCGVVPEGGRPIGKITFSNKDMADYDGHW